MTGDGTAFTLYTHLFRSGNTSQYGIQSILVHDFLGRLQSLPYEGIDDDRLFRIDQSISSSWNLQLVNRVTLSSFAKTGFPVKRQRSGIVTLGVDRQMIYTAAL
jgi:hypothetical protein